MKKFKILSLVFCCFFILFSFTACSLTGESAYEIAVKNGFVGTEEEWLESLKGEDGEYAAKGLSAYEIAVKNGFVGTEEEWLQSLVEKLKTDETNLQFATNLAMRSSVKITADSSAGSGTIISYDQTSKIAHILTCFHVIVDSTNKSNYASNNIYVQFYGSEDTNIKYSASFLGGAPYSDIAILAVTISSQVWEKYDLMVAQLDTSNGVLGETCIAIGNSKNKGLNAVRGNISRGSQLTSINNFTGLAGNSTLRVMRFNAIVAHGNSGGGLFDGKGKLIGVVNSKSASEEEMNFSFAIPLNVAYGIYVNTLNQLEANSSLDYAMAKRCKIGLELAIAGKGAKYDDATMNYYSVDEVSVLTSEIGELKTNDILLSATLKREGNEIKTIEINSVYDLPELMWQAEIGDVLTIKYKRQNIINNVNITISKTIPSLYAIRENLTCA